jgi:hypothetical protein
MQFVVDRHPNIDTGPAVTERWRAPAPATEKAQRSGASDTGQRLNCETSDKTDGSKRGDAERDRDGDERQHAEHGSHAKAVDRPLQECHCADDERDDS